MTLVFPSFNRIIRLTCLARESWQGFSLRLCRAIALMLTGTAFAVGTASIAHAQDIEPRAYSSAPIGVNFLIAGYAYTQGAVPFGASLPVKNAQLDTSNAVLAFARVFELWGQSGKFHAIVPYSWFSGTAEVTGEPAECIVNGPADSRFRVSLNLYGAPALSLKEFRDFEQDLIVGASLIGIAWQYRWDAGL